jgi:hypothetical protein
MWSNRQIKYCVEIKIVYFESSFHQPLVQVQAQSWTLLNIIFERLGRVVTKIRIAYWQNHPFWPLGIRNRTKGWFGFCCLNKLWECRISNRKTDPLKCHSQWRKWTLHSGDWALTSQSNNRWPTFWPKALWRL